MSYTENEKLNDLEQILPSISNSFDSDLQIFSAGDLIRLIATLTLAFGAFFGLRRR